MNTGQKITHDIYANSNYLHIPLTSKILSVAEGDLIKLVVQANIDDLIKAYDNGTYLSVEVVD